MYALSNITSGAYTLTFTTGAVGGSTLLLPQGQTIIAICDGTNVYNAQSATSSTINALTLGNGSAANPSLSFLGDATTGLYLAASHQLGFAVAGVSAGTLSLDDNSFNVGVSGIALSSSTVLDLNLTNNKTANGLVIELQAENPDFKNIVVDGRQANFAVEGQAVGLIRAEGL